MAMGDQAESIVRRPRSQDPYQHKLNFSLLFLISLALCNKNIVGFHTLKKFGDPNNKSETSDFTFEDLGEMLLGTRTPSAPAELKLWITSEGLGEMFEGDCADTCPGKTLLV